MQHFEKYIKFKQIHFLVNNKVVNSLENYALDSSFKNFKSQVNQLLNIDITEYIISLQSSSEGKKDSKENINQQQDYESYIHKAHIQDSGTIHVYLDNQKLQVSNPNKEILDSCFEDYQKVNESFEFQPDENIKTQNQQTNLNQKYDASEAIIETSELSMVNPSIVLSQLHSKQRSSEYDSNNFNGNIKKASISNLNILTTKSNEKLTQSNEVAEIPEIFQEIKNQDFLENIINYEIMRQILNTFPKLQPDNIEDDIKIKQHIAYLQQQNAASRRSTSPQPKQQKKNDLSQSIVLSNYKCNICREQIENVRFHCLVCKNTDHCENCQREKRGDHNHPFMKYKNVTNVTSNKLNKSQRLFNNQMMNNLGNNLASQENFAAPNNVSFPFSQIVRNTTGPFGNISSATQSAIKTPLLTSNSNVQSGVFNFQNLQKSNISSLAQTMPSAQRQQQSQFYQFQQQPQQQQMQNQFFNPLQQSQNLNIPLPYTKEHFFNEMFTNQVTSQTYNQSNIPQSNINSALFQLNNQINQTNFSSNSSNQNSSENLTSQIKIINLSQNQTIRVAKGQQFTVTFMIKNSSQIQFPEGTVIKGNGSFKHVQQRINPLKYDEIDEIKLELKAPTNQTDAFQYFKITFPNGMEYPLRLSFELQLL
ncbi:ZZ-type zinc finger protein (macronuclear) [Tetrahymena thermophila SB210]|uniref:ZZ-type zinc finger protein n=1 Tax=Tetrahymena thermophila (strain SB210) TaxID=312017 RepID=W7XBR7_TETTS|nr:ZZ-type zinc finger protein [Tetrahymena thermophila SB210]EWS71126.1 ZZ-type zinc finger protein [Tetrahymena thermophila SB210]|eukprot:XP_012656334.1 ZZ-type zinc finger protein [Tetrahymena thermophila SB210]